MKNVNLILQKLKRPMFGIAVFVFSVLSYSPSIAALSQAERDSIYKDTVWYKTNASIQCGTAAASDGTLGSGAPGGSYGSDQLKAFATTPISSTWNISDSTVEKWFLSQTNATPVILRYGLNAGNIGAITSAVKAAGVSPVFFYAYTVSEGGASNGRNLGFINHTDRSGLSAVAAATADAQYLADASKIMTSKPSWIDAGNPVDFVPQEVKDAGDADFQKMPSGSIGRAYIPATAAAAWEVYYPDGLKKEYNQVQDYGSPLQNVMQDIKSMGGDPMQGGTTIPSGVCEGGTGVAGEGMTKAINWAVMIANNDGYGYDSSAARTTGWVKWQSDPNCTNQCGSFDCSSLISAALTVAGYFDTNPNFWTGNEAQYLEGAGFKKVATSATTSQDLLPGDILLANDHTSLYIGSKQMVAAHINENGDTSGGQVGDQTKGEISVSTYQDHNPPYIAVYRATK